MKVLQQSIQHFWQRGALTADQVHYLVEHGFVQRRTWRTTNRRPKRKSPHRRPLKCFCRMKWNSRRRNWSAPWAAARGEYCAADAGPDDGATW